MNGEITTANQEINKFDPFQASVDALLVAAFPKVSSKHFPMVLSIAHAAKRYAQTEIGGSVLNVAVFEKGPSDAGRALALIKFAKSWKSLMLFSGGRLLNDHSRISRTLSCYSESLACNDFRAHCFKVIEDPLSRTRDIYGLRKPSASPGPAPLYKQKVESPRYSFPCRLLLGYTRLEPDHPSSPIDQISASAAQVGCNMCPNFDANNFKVVGRSFFEDGVFE